MPKTNSDENEAAAIKRKEVDIYIHYDRENKRLIWNEIPGASSYTIYHADGSLSGPPPEPRPPAKYPWRILCSNIKDNFYPVAPKGFKQWVCGKAIISSWGSPSPIDPHNPH